MDELLDAIVDLVSLVSPNRVNVIASQFRGLADCDGAPKTNSLADTPAAREAVDRVLAAWQNVPTSGNELAGLMLGASHARVRAERDSSIELVWTGPTTRFVPMRRTAQVLVDLIAAARSEVFLVSFIAYDIDRVLAAMRDAIGRGVRIRVLLEASTVHGGTLNVDPAALIRGQAPGVELFTWKERSAAFVDGKVHAKVVVVDGARAFITSANLTGNALEKNMEAGVVIHGGAVPKTLSDHLQALIDVGVVCER
jgi:cardiolipin synthase